jgi:type II secretory pathway pseudopilin PulG
MKKNAGMTLLEVVFTIGLIAIVSSAIMAYRTSMSQSSQLSRYVASRDRILASVRTVAGMPAALRNSMRASNDGVNPVNPQLNNCIVGTNSEQCSSSTTSGFVLYSPIVGFDGSGNVTGVTPITIAGPPPSPITTGATQGYDSFGAPCSPTGANCPFQIYTSFQPQCAPSPLPTPSPTPIPSSALEPAPTCTVADVINVTYWVALDPAAATLPGLAALITPASGQVTTSVSLISGNQPQQ